MKGKRPIDKKPVLISYETVEHISAHGLGRDCKSLATATAIMYMNAFVRLRRVRLRRIVDDPYICPRSERNVRLFCAVVQSSAQKSTNNESKKTQQELTKVVSRKDLFFIITCVSELIKKIF